MGPAAPSPLRPAFAAARPEGPLRLLRLPLVLTLLAIPLDVLAWLSGPIELFWTYVFWEALLWGGVALYVAGLWFERVRLPRTA